MFAVGLPGIGPMEGLIILAIVVIIFGVGRLPEVGGAIGKSIREFRKASKEPEEPPDELRAQASMPSPGTCSKCGAQLSDETKFCAECGAPTQAAVS